MKIRPPKFIRRIIDRLKGLFFNAKAKVSKSLRLQLILTFVICLIATWMALVLTNQIFGHKIAMINYYQSMSDIDSRARSLAEGLTTVYDEAYPNETKALDSILDKAAIQEQVNESAEYYNTTFKILITDLNGKVLFKSTNATETQVDIHSIIRNAMDTRINLGNDVVNSGTNQRDEFFSFYPVDLHDIKAYVVMSGIPEPTLVYREEGSPLLSFIAGLATFMGLFYLLTKRKMGYIEELAQGLFEISKGDLDFRVTRKSEDELGSLASNINNMAQKLKLKIEEERKAERTKNELITSVSHDLRTPLTSIMGYLRLLKDKKAESQDQVDSYIDIAYGKSEKLKSLIEDLFEYTKLANYGDILQKEKVCLNELLQQLLDELIPVSEENQLTFATEFLPEKIMIYADADKIVRVFENLLMNAIRYSYKPGQIRVKMFSNNGKVTVAIENEGDNITQAEISRLFERFYRVDQSRTSANGGGSGLGLAIAKNIIDLHDGTIWAECKGNHISFLVRLNESMI